MITVYKYPLEHMTNTVRMPHNAWIMTVQMQNGKPCLWAEVDPEAKQMYDRRFIVVGTGWELPQRRIYIGTTQADGLVWHIYEEIK